MLVVNKLRRALRGVSEFPEFQRKSAAVANLEMQSGAFAGMKGLVRSTLLLIGCLLGDLLFHLARLESRF